MPENQIDRDELRRMENANDQWVTGGVFAFEFLFVLQIISVEHLDIPLKLSLYCFSIGSPFSFVGVAITKDLLRSRKVNEVLGHKLFNILSFIIFSFFIIGVFSIFFHFSAILGTLFIVSSLVGLLFWGKFLNLMK